MKIDFLLAPIFDDEGNVRRLVASTFDITDREHALERVEFLNELCRASLYPCCEVGRYE